MKKKILSLIFAICLILPCAFIFSACGNNEKQKYTVIWKNYDGSILEVDVDVEEGTLPTFDGEDNPTKPSTDQYNYTFSGWSPEVEKLTQNTTYIAQFSSELTNALISFNLNGGETDSDSSSKLVPVIDGSYFFFDVTKSGYKFLGWTYENELVLDKDGNTKKEIEIEENMEFVALFDNNVKLTYEYSNNKAGSATGFGNTTCGSEIDIKVTVNEGYTFVGIYDGDQCLSTNLNYTYTMPTRDVTLTFKFGLTKYRLYYWDGLGGWGHANLYKFDEITVESDFDITYEVSKNGHTFIEWKLCSNDQVVNHISSGYTSDVNIYAVFSINQYTVSAVSLDESKGAVSGSGKDYYMNSFTITAVPKNDYVFVGWYEDENCLVKVSSSAEYSYFIPAKDITYYALFMTEQDKIQLLKETNGEIPTILNEGQYITYGICPTTYVTERAVCNSLNALKENPQGSLQDNGFYKYNDEYYYYLDGANPVNSIQHFSNGETVNKDGKYWFKCEAIKWRVLSVNEHTYTVISENVLFAAAYVYSDSPALQQNISYDGIEFYGQVTNYTTSYVRQYINTIFLSNYFPQNDTYIVETYADNELGDGEDVKYYESPNTNDKFVIPSVGEMFNKNYFEDKSSRITTFTDFNLAQGVSYYWTRTPVTDWDKYLSHIVVDMIMMGDGIIMGSDVSNLMGSRCGVRPMATFDLSELLSD